MSLKQEQQAELNKFLTYLRTKRESCFKEAEMTYDEFKTDNVIEQIYNKEDVDGLVEKLYSELKKTFTEEINNLIKAAGAYVEVALADAENNGHEIHIDVNYLENAAITLSQAGESFKALEKKSTDLGKKAAGVKLASLGGDKDLQLKVTELTKEVEALRAKNQQMQADLIKMNKEKGGAKEFALKSEMQYQDEIDELKKALQKAEENVKELKADMNKKLSESTQVTTLKKMMQQRNEQIKDLRKRLSKYEHVEEVKNDDG